MNCKKKSQRPHFIFSKCTQAPARRSIDVRIHKMTHAQNVLLVSVHGLGDGCSLFVRLRVAIFQLGYSVLNIKV